MRHGTVSIFLLVTKEAAIAWVRDKAMRLSAALSLYTLLSTAPMLVITVLIGRAVWREHSHFGQSMMDEVALLTGPQVADALRPLLDYRRVHESSGLATLASMLLLLFSATSMFVELQDAMNTIWRVKDQPHGEVRRYLRDRLLSLVLVVCVEILLLLSIAGAGVMVGISNHLRTPTLGLAMVKNVVIPCGLAFAVFSILYKVLPSVRLKWKHVRIGALIAAILFTIGRYGLILYFHYHSPTSLFGAAGSLAAVLLWVYYSSFSLFYGAEFTKAWASRYHRYRPRLKSSVTPKARRLKSILKSNGPLSNSLEA
ncbi:MAG TPA: YihY/virulence factor BrkB family protein [Tepidisphaeraceae bacterium]|nr:YihY/virulence factor BrkB family protein [Tepidisphaeraceae bacterium]